MIDASARMSDGRTVAYTDLGAATGPVVFYLHGAPSSRLDLVALDAEFGQRGVRVVSPDRPGYGGSTPQPNRRLEDWPADVVALADQLGVDRFGVIGLSSGGPYAMACAALASDRVAAAMVVAGTSDPAWEGFADQYQQQWPDTFGLYACADDASASALCEELYGADGRGFLQQRREFGRGDRVWFRTQPAMVDAFYRSVGEAFRQGVGGLAQDMVCEARPWAFDASSITVPTRVLHGETDILLPVGHSQHNADLIGQGDLEIIPEHGHVSVFGLFPQFSEDLAAHAA